MKSTIYRLNGVITVDDVGDYGYRKTKLPHGAISAPPEIATNYGTCKVENSIIMAHQQNKANHLKDLSHL